MYPEIKLLLGEQFDQGLHCSVMLPWIVTQLSPIFILSNIQSERSMLKEVPFLELYNDMKHGSVDINPFMSSGLFYLNSLDQSISSLRGVWSVLIITMFLAHLSHSDKVSLCDHTLSIVRSASSVCRQFLQMTSPKPLIGF